MSPAARVTVGAWLAVLLIGAVLIMRAPFLTDMSVFLPSAPSAEQRLLIESLKSGVASRLLLVGVDGVPADHQAAFSRALAERLRAEASLRRVDNGDVEGFDAERRLLFESRYLLSPAVDAGRFEVPALRAAIGEAIDSMAGVMGMMARNWLARDPTAEMLVLLDRLQRGQAPRSHDGVWVSTDGRRLALLAHTAASGADLDGQQRALAAVERAFGEVVAAQRVPGASLVLSGPGRFAVESREAIRGDVSRLSTISTGLILLLLGLVYRSLVAMALSLVPMVSAVICGAAAVAVVFGALHGLTLGFGATLVGEAVDYALYFLTRGASNAGPGFWSTIRLGVLTSVVGFAALLFSGFPGLGQLAVFSIAGLVGAALATRFVLPVLTPSTFRPRDLGALETRLATIVAALRGLRWPIAALIVVAIGVIVLRKDHLWDRDIASLSPVSAVSQRIDADLRDTLVAPDARTLLIVGAPDQEQALQAAEALAPVLDAEVAAGRITGYESPADWLPSRATQQRRQQALPDPETLRDRLRPALAGLPLRAERLEPFVADVAAARSGPLLDRARLADTLIGLRIESLLVEEPGRFAVVIPLRAPAGGSIDAIGLGERLRAAGQARASVLDLKGESDRLYGSYLREAILLSLAGAAAIVALLAVALRSLRGWIAVVTPLAGAVVLVIATFALMNREMNLLHLVGLLLVVAVGSNYALFFRLQAARADAAGGTLAGLLIANLTTVTGFGVLASASVPLLSALGATVGLGAFLSLLLAAAWAGGEATTREGAGG